MKALVAPPVFAPDSRATAPWWLFARRVRGYRSGRRRENATTPLGREVPVNRASVSVVAFVLAAGAVAGVPRSSAAQVRRSASPNGAGAPAGEAPKGTPRSARNPYAGVWDGSFTITRGPGAEHGIPIVMLLTVADSAKGEYAGATILPNGARAPHLETTVANGEMRWKQENSGGGFWMYSARMAGRDSIAGTVSLEDWPQLPAGEKAPTGTFSLVRRAPGV